MAGPVGSPSGRRPAAGPRPSAARRPAGPPAACPVAPPRGIGCTPPGSLARPAPIRHAPSTCGHRGCPQAATAYVVDVALVHHGFPSRPARGPTDRVEARARAPRGLASASRLDGAGRRPGSPRCAVRNVTGGRSIVDAEGHEGAGREESRADAGYVSSRVLPVRPGEHRRRTDPYGPAQVDRTPRSPSRHPRRPDPSSTQPARSSSCAGTSSMGFARARVFESGASARRQNRTVAYRPTWRKPTRS